MKILWDIIDIWSTELVTYFDLYFYVDFVLWDSTVFRVTTFESSIRYQFVIELWLLLYPQGRVFVENILLKTEY